MPSFGSNSNSNSNSSRNSTQNSVRIIGGKFRGRRLNFKPIEGLRPSSDRVRETLFNWLMNDLIDSRGLDLYAGTGVLGLEALSRGAVEIIFLERDKNTAENIKKSIQELGLNQGLNQGLNSRAQVKNLDVLFFLDQPRVNHYAQVFDLIFCDPPFFKNLLLETLDLLIKNHWVGPESLIYLECEPDVKILENLSAREKLGQIKILKQKRTAQVVYSLVRVEAQEYNGE